MRSISIFFPALNEEENIEECITAATGFFNTLHIDYEIIVINNRSTDHTEEIVSDIAKQDPHVVLVNALEKQGYGAAIQKGVSVCTKDVVVFTDADLQFRIGDLEKFLEIIDSTDFVIGYRKACMGRSRFVKYVNALFSVFLGVRVRDVGCDFKMFHKDVIRSVELISTGTLVNVEIVYKLQRKGFHYKEVPVSYYPRNNGVAKRIRFKRMLVEFFKLKFNLSVSS